jgi:hypothetical protein
VARRSSGAAAWTATGVAGLAGLALLHLWVPPEGRESAVCLLRRLLGIPCPGCGLTRAFAHLAKGEWSAAIVAHPFAPVLAFELGLLWAAWGARLAGFRMSAGAPPAGAGAGGAGAGSGTVPAGGPAVGSSPAWVEPLVLANVAVLWALWLGRAATGTLPW